MSDVRIETDSLGKVRVPADKLWGAQTQRSLEHFSIGKDLIPREMITAYATLKKAAAIANRDGKRLDDQSLQADPSDLRRDPGRSASGHVSLACLDDWQWDPVQHERQRSDLQSVLPARWHAAGKPRAGSSQRSCQHGAVVERFVPFRHVHRRGREREGTPRSGRGRPPRRDRREIAEWDNVIKIGRTHMQDATPLTLGQEWSGYAGMLSDDLERIEAALSGVYRLALGGTAVGTGINSAPGFAEAAAAEIAKLASLPFVTAPNKFAVQGAHDALVQLSGTLRTLAVSLYKIANDIRLMSCGPRAGFAELVIPENEPGSSIMPGKVNPTQCEALTMIAVQVMANDVAVGFGDAGGYLEMNVYKPLIIQNITHSITIMTDGCANFHKFLMDGTKPNLKKIDEYVERSLMLVTALSPVIGYDKASRIAHYAIGNDLTLKAAALKLGYVTEAQFDRVVDPKKMVRPYVATK